MQHYNFFLENISFSQWINPKKYSEKFENYIKVLIEKFDKFYIQDVINEIEKELGRHNNSKAFILRILRDFQNISPYFLINVKKEYSNHLGKNTITIGKMTYDESTYFFHKTLESYCGWGEKEINYEEISIYEEYVIDCFTFFELFFYQFDKLCLDYDIDIVRIQEENDIIIWIRNSHSLISEGYGNKLKSISIEKENNQSKTVEKEPTKKETYLFEIGLKLALGEFNEDLIIKEGNISLNEDLSFPKLANKYQLNEQYLKCTINNYTDVSNRSKNLRNNPEIIQKVLTHLESINKEPKDWFLKEFKTIVL